MSDKNLYNDDSIQSLSPLEHVRLRPGMYAGNTSDATQLAIEILGNSIDEWNIGHGNIIDVDIKDNIIKISDQAQGLPINVVRDDGKTVLQASFDEINTSGKYSKDGVYEGVAIGLNGIGGKLTNFLSHWMKVFSVNANGDYESVSFKEGVFQERKIGKAEKPFHSGTTVEFLPSEEFFDTPTVNLKKLENFCEDITCLCPGLIINFNDRKIIHENGVQDLLVRQINSNDVEIIEQRLISTVQVGKQKMSFGLTYTANSNTIFIPYVNCGITSAGPHITTIKTCLTRVLNKWAREQGILKEKDKNLDGNSLHEGIIFVTNITAENVAYDAQVKSTLTKIDTNFINTVLGKELELWLDNNPSDGKAIIEKALIARKASEAARKAREAIKNKVAKPKKKKFLDMPTTLVDANNKDRSKCELIVTEGLSAQSSLVAERDASRSAIYAVRGMMLNVQRTASEKIMRNQEINNLVTALGLDYNSATGQMIFDKKKMRYGKIIAASDSDPAGNEIENLLFNIIWQLCPDLIKLGYVYSAEPPLFKVTTKDNKYIFLSDQQALNDFMSKTKQSNIKAIHRAKG